MSVQHNYTNILVVDDEPLVLSYITSILRRMGCKNVLEARTANQAATEIQDQNISLFICDITLPDGDGRALAATLLENRPDAIVVLITGFSTSDIALSSDIKDRVLLLEKPFTPDDVSALVGKYFKPVEVPALACVRALAAAPLHAAA
jgi:DNA-binding NtrC family response regulator